ncbi:unnamed protein product [Peronospora destructor]|uniref:Uncharacterized protein n=1 Tax=Peronospora destructor TaxID=86335 RepID=A0AAV0TBT1_9STRA|nr:unnamed protein product [Peronospora destructor]
MDWKALRGSCESGNAVRNLDMKRHRRPLFPAFEADLVKFIRAHMEEEGDNGSALNDVEESQLKTMVVSVRCQ